jgi:hypothetical protein
MNAAGIENAKAATAASSRIQSPFNWKLIASIVLSIILIIGIAIGVYFLIDSVKHNKDSMPSPENNKKILERQIGGKTGKMIDSLLTKKKGIIQSLNIVKKTTEGFQNTSKKDIIPDKITVQRNEISLLNFCVLGHRLGGYAGPKVNGVFAEEEVMDICIQGGVRLFIFDIDYINDTLKPKVVCRDKTGNLLSNNTASIRKCMRAIRKNMDLGATKGDPIIIVLSFLRYPDTPQKVYRFMSDVARELYSITKYMLRQTTSAVYDKQRMASELFLRPITDYENKVIILSNANTSIFNDPDMKKYNISIGESINQYTNLDLYINARIFTNTDDTLLSHLSKPEKSDVVSVRANSVNFYQNIPDKDTSNVVNDTKKEFTIAMNYTFSDDTPTDDMLKLLHGTYGVNCIPVNLFYKPDNKEELDKNNPAVILPILTDKWFSTYSYILKPRHLRYSIPDEIPMAAPPKAANTGGGFIKTPNIK